MEILEKAWVVYHNDMIGGNFAEGFWNKDQIPPIYAATRAEAKKDGGDAYDYVKNDGSEIKYTDLRATRARDHDKVLFEGEKGLRYRLEYRIKKNKEEKKQMDKVKSLPDDATFFVQNGYVGNSVLWWAKGSSGYTADIEKAHLYSKEDIVKGFITGNREEDTVWESSHIMENVKHHVDAQYLSKKFAL